MQTMETVSVEDGHMAARQDFPLLYTAISFIAGIIIFKVIAPFLSPLFCVPYRQLSKVKQAEFNCNVLTLCMAGTVGAISVCGVFLDTQVVADKVWGTSLLSRVAVGITSGYMLSHFIIFTFVEPAIFFGWIYVFHHFLALLATYTVGINRTSAFLFYLGYLSEVSNTFLCIHCLLESVGHKKSSLLFVANGFLFAISHLVTRIFTIPIVWYIIYLTGLPGTGRPWDWVFGYVALATAALNVLNCYWFTLILNEVKSFFCGKSDDATVDKKVE